MKTEKKIQYTKAFNKIQLHDCCMNHCRDWRETKSGLLPPSDHSPGCKNYIEKMFVRISLDGVGFVDTERNAMQFLDDDPERHRYVIEKVFMTQDQFENLEEFQGF